MSKFKIARQQDKIRALKQTIRRMSEENAMLKSEEKYANLNRERKIEFDKLSQEWTQSENLLKEEYNRLTKIVDNIEKDRLAIYVTSKDYEHKLTISNDSLVETVLKHCLFHMGCENGATVHPPYENNHNLIVNYPNLKQVH
ncbi:MAG: hypothetical protein LBU04_06190 [Christensenellaceae bacterium]|jgi:hypothetical protein|nr:hypothetical protein [Christensenellaceae bacterium]